MKKELHIDQTLYTILQVLSVSLFEKTTIMELFAKPMNTLESIKSQKQLYLFNF
jgi:hypothetical protein